MTTNMEVDTEITDIPKFLLQQRQHAPSELQAYYVSFEELYERKLWHQLTLKVDEFVREPNSGPLQIPLHKGFLEDWEDKMNKLKFVEIGLSAARQFQELPLALSFLQKHVTPKVNNLHSQEAFVLATTESAHFQLLLGMMEETKKALDESEKILQSFDSVETVIWASYYRVGTEYYKAKGEYASYYRTALLYLACVNVIDLPEAERVERAYDLSIAALLGETIYNFGELLMHPILDSLKGTPHDWLRSLLFAFNAGDIGKFEALAPHFSQQPLLSHSHSVLSHKIRLMALIEAVFHRPTSSRTILFESIATETRLPIEQVEHLVMKALSLGLIQGEIDQVASVVVVKWVQPRVLDRTQIRSMKVVLETWGEKVKGVEGFVENEGGEIFAQ